MKMAIRKSEHRKANPTRANRWIITVLILCAMGVLWPRSAHSSGWISSAAVENDLDIGDPINARTRSYYFNVPIFDLGGPLPVNMRLIYQSSGSYGTGFLPAIPQIWRRELSVAHVVRWGGGDGSLFFENTQTNGLGNWENGVYAAYQYGLEEQAGSNGWFYLMDPSDQSVYLFEKDGHADDDENQKAALRYHMDRNGNRVSYTYTDFSGLGKSWGGWPNTTTIGDGLGRDITLSIMTGTNISISDGTRNYTLGNTNWRPNRTECITDPLGNVTRYEYDNTDSYNTWLTNQVLPEGNSPYSQTLDFVGRVITQSDAYGNTTTLAVQSGPYPSSNFVTEQRPDGNQVVYETPHLGSGMRSWEDSQGNSASMTVNSNDQMTVITDRLGDTTSMSYHEPTGFLASVTNAMGNALNHSYTAQSQTFTNPANAYVFSFTFYNRTRTDYPDGSHETVAYDGRGNPTNHIDRNGKCWALTYNSQGLPLTLVNPAGGMITHTYNPDGTRASSMDSDTGITTYGYDTFKRLAGINPQGAGQVDIRYDLMNHVTSVTNESGHSVHYQYDGNGNLTRVVDPSGNAEQYDYDLMDRMVQTISRTSGTNSLNYNFRGALAGATDANGIQTTYSYNSRDWLESVRRNSKTHSFTQDDEGVPTGSTSPVGRNVQQQTDKLGHLTTIILPGGETNLFSRDTMSRVIDSTDPLGHLTQYGYDSNGILSKVTLPDSSSATYSRDSLGSLTGINDLNGQNWHFTYSSMGRLVSTVDPLSRTNSYTHDARGRIATVTYADGSTESNSYDNIGNLIRRFYSDGTDLTFSHDALDNLTTCNELALTRDDNERITSSTYNGQTFGATYDAGGRVVTATYGGVLTVTYTYNADDLLSRIADTLGNQLDFNYDADGNITNTVRANGLNANYIWDANSRLSRLQDAGIIDLTYAHDDAGQITAITGDYPLPPVDTNSATAEYTVDAASQISDPGHSYDDRGRATALPGHTLGWDAAERLTTLDGTVTFTYNGLHQIVSRTEGGTTTHYHHNHAMGLSPIVAEQQGASFIRYYVYTPSGQLLYSIAPQSGNAVAYYHRDQIGSVLALSNGAGAVTDRYVYSPFGELLDHTGTSKQPYTFVGTLGVRQEGGLYQMRRRYYDPATARFLSKEPIWPQTDDPQSLNPYQYAALNPLQYVDPQGTYYQTPASLNSAADRYDDMADGYAEDLRSVREEAKLAAKDHLKKSQSIDNTQRSSSLNNLYHQLQTIEHKNRVKALDHKAAELRRLAWARRKEANKLRKRAKKVARSRREFSKVRICPHRTNNEDQIPMSKLPDAGLFLKNAINKMNEKWNDDVNDWITDQGKGSLLGWFSD